MNKNDKVAVCSRSFSKNSILKAELVKKYKNVTFNVSGEILKKETLVKFLSGHNKAIIGLEEIDASILDQLPELKVISKYGVGLDMIDIKALQKKKVKLGWSGGVNRRSVSELVISFAISLLRHIPLCQKEIQKGKWNPRVGSYLTGKTFGIIGCGNIGKDLVKLLQPFDCKILVNDILSYKNFYEKYNIEQLEIEKLLAKSEIVSLHVPLNNSTRNFITRQRLALMKKESILINTARGGLIDEIALKDRLVEGNFSAALDVFSTEPPEDMELLNSPNLIVTPHIGGNSYEAILEMGKSAINGLDNNSIPDSILFKSYN